MSHSAKRAVLIVVVVAIGLSITAFIFDRFTLSSLYARVPDRAVNLIPAYDLYEKDYPRTNEEFQLNGYTLRGHVYGEANERGLIVFRHGLFSKHADYLPMILAMVDKGWRVFAYDAIGCGESDGDSTLGMSQSPIDVVAAIDYARENGLADGLPLVLWGHSWGGYGVAAALAQRPDVDACTTMSGFDSPMKILDASAASSFGPIGKLQYPFLWLNTFIDFGNAADISASQAIATSGVPTLAIHGSGDTTVPYDGVSIMDSLQKRTAEPPANADFGLMEAEGRNGHNDYFYSPESQKYLNECAARLQELLEEAGDDPQAPEVQDYLKSIDLKAANTPDPALINRIDTFFHEQTGK